MTSHEEMDARILRKEKAGTHFHPEFELDFAVDGELEVTVKDTSFILPKENFILINSGIPHSLEFRAEDAVCCQAMFPCRSVARMAGEENLFFYCSSVEKSGPEYTRLRKTLHELVYLLAQKPRRTGCMKQSLLYRILDSLLEDFRLDPDAAGAAYSDDVKLMQILQYIGRNFQDSVSLTELADQMYMSKSTLSRFFKKETGVYFADYVNEIRLQYAAEDLIYSGKNITRIASDCGFSNPSAFNKIFREHFGKSPTEYRAEKKGKAKKETGAPVLRKEQQRALEEEMAAEQEQPVQKAASVCADAAGGKPFPKKWGQCINIGSAYMLTLANLQYHALYLKEHLGFQYGRVWSIFSKKLMISDGRTIGYYNYDTIDSVLDFLVSNQITPFLDFGNRPDTAVYEPGVPVYCEAEYIPFASKAVWQDLLGDFILHITNRYGEREVSGWIFEFSYDLTHSRERNYYEDPDFSYFDAFCSAFRIIKKAVPAAKVGGPMAEIGFDYDFISKFLKSSSEKNCRPDFVSFMLFPYHTNRQESGISTERSFEPNSEQAQVELMRRVMEENGCGNCSLFITEWNNTLSNRNYLNDSCFRAAYAAKTIAAVSEQADLLAVWMASDWMSSYYDTVRIANGGSGILTKDTIRKPVYFVLEFLRKMGTTRIGGDTNSLITKSGIGNYHILCFNFKWFGINYFARSENVQDPEKIRMLFEDDRKLEINFALDHASPDTGFIVKKRSISRDSGNFLSEWGNLLYDRNLSSSDIRYLRESCYPKMSMERAASSGDGSLKLQVVLQPQEVMLLHIYEDPERKA